MSRTRITTANYPEALVGIMLQHALTISINSTKRITLLDLSTPRDEQGSDALANLDSAGQIYPFYMQFKRPSQIVGGKRSKLTQERSIAKAKKVSPIYYFWLRKMAKSKSICQHNALIALSNKAMAAYVCPLHMTKTTYLESIYKLTKEAIQSKPANQAFHSFTNKNISTRKLGNKRMAHFKNIPFFREHVSIPPRGKVKDIEAQEHRYSFSTDGKEVCFHSPEVVENCLPFGKWLQNMYENSERHSFNCRDKNKLIEIFSPLLEIESTTPAEEKDFPILELTDDITPTETPYLIPEEVNIDTWIEFGSKLYVDYNVCQLAFSASCE